MCEMTQYFNYFGTEEILENHRKNVNTMKQNIARFCKKRCLLYQIHIMTLKNRMKPIKLQIRFTLSQSQKKSIIQYGIDTIEAIIKMSTTFL